MFVRACLCVCECEREEGKRIGSVYGQVDVEERNRRMNVSAWRRALRLVWGRYSAVGIAVGASATCTQDVAGHQSDGVGWGDGGCLSSALRETDLL